jgi:hypothetical protein
MSYINVAVICAQGEVVAVGTETSTGDLFSSFQAAQVPLFSLVKGLGVDHLDESTTVHYHLNSVRQLALLVELGKVVGCHQDTSDRSYLLFTFAKEMNLV